MSEPRFLSRFDEGDGPAEKVPELHFLELHPLGRVENGYRFAGETDVFMPIEAVARNYKIAIAGSVDVSAPGPGRCASRIPAANAT